MKTIIALFLSLLLATGAAEASPTLLTLPQSWSAALRVVPVALSVSGGAIATDATLGNIFNVTPTTATATTMSAPTTPLPGQKILYNITQPAGGSATITWNAAFNFNGTCGGSAPTLSTTAAYVDEVGFIYVNSLSQWVCLGTSIGIH